MIRFIFIYYFIVETIDETESKHEKESISSRTGRDTMQPTTGPPAATDPTTTKSLAAVPVASATKSVRKCIIIKKQILLFSFISPKNPKVAYVFTSIYKNNFN
jgi:hypothetical protein